MFDSEFVEIIIKYKGAWYDSASYKLHVNYAHGLTLFVCSEQIQILQSRDMSKYSNVELLSANEKKTLVGSFILKFFWVMSCVFQKKAAVQYGSTMCGDHTIY